MLRMLKETQIINIRKTSKVHKNSTSLLEVVVSTLFSIVDDFYIVIFSLFHV